MKIYNGRTISMPRPKRKVDPYQEIIIDLTFKFFLHSDLQLVQQKIQVNFPCKNIFGFAYQPLHQIHDQES